MAAVRRVRVFLKAATKNTTSVLNCGNRVNTCMGKDPVKYAGANPPLTVLQAQIAKTTLAQQQVALRAPGAGAACRVERMALVGMLETECAYVQTLCDAVSPEQAVLIAQGGGMAVANFPTRQDPILAVVLGTLSGTVELDANATALAGRSRKLKCFNWQWTTDGGKTFNNAPSTPHAKTTIANLPPLTMVGFRVNITNAAGPGEWSQIVTILVH